MQAILLSLLLLLVTNVDCSAYNSELYKSVLNDNINRAENIQIKPLFSSISSAKQGDIVNYDNYDKLISKTKKLQNSIYQIQAELKRSNEANESVISFEKATDKTRDKDKRDSLYSTASQLIQERLATALVSIKDSVKIYEEISSNLTPGITSKFKQDYDKIALTINAIDPSVNGLNEDLKLTKKTATAEDEGTRKFAGLNFGVGVSLTIDIGNEDRIENASVENGIVRVSKSKNSIPRVVLESHYFFVPKNSFLYLVDEKLWGWGPFIALQPGTENVIDAIGWGFMVGFRRSVDSSASWNFGCGMIVDPNARILGSGMKADQPIPPGETQVRYEERSQWGILLMSSFSF